MTAGPEGNAAEPDPAVWLAALRPHERRIAESLLASGQDYEGACKAWLDAASPENTAPFGASPGLRRFYELFLDELHDFLCGGEKYEEQRGQIIEGFRGGQATTVASLTIIIAPVLGAAPAFLAPAVALVLCAVSSMGLNAWCKMQSERRAEAAEKDGEEAEQPGS